MKSSLPTIFLSTIFLLLSPQLSESISTYASFRKDYYLPDLKEVIKYPVPVDGGRVHLIISGASACGSNESLITSATVNGQEALNLPSNGTLDFTFFDWTRIFQSSSGQADRIWLSFHSRNNDWLPATTASSPKELEVALKNDKGTCFEGKINVYPPSSDKNSLALSYATTRKGGMELVMHFHNGGEKEQTILSMECNGKNVSTGPVSVGPGQTYISVIDISTTSSGIGDIWTVGFTTSTGISDEKKIKMIPK